MFTKHYGTFVGRYWRAIACRRQTIVVIVMMAVGAARQGIVGILIQFAEGTGRRSLTAKIIKQLKRYLNNEVKQILSLPWAIVGRKVVASQKLDATGPTVKTKPNWLKAKPAEVIR